MKDPCLLLIIILGLLVSCKSLCPLDEVINEKIQERISSLTSEDVLKTLVLDCTSVTSRGNLATCSAGFQVSGCACGSACGSWDVRGGNTCHCQCAGMDWTAARCCRLRVAA